MPTGTPNYGFILPYPVRVDSFTSPRDPAVSPPALYLLSHVHSDHTTGLGAKSFAGRVICSIDSKAMLLNLEPCASRISVDKEIRSEPKKSFSHLKRDPVARGDGTLDFSGARDLLASLSAVSYLS